MSDTPESSPVLSRRQFLKLLTGTVAAGALTFAAACGRERTQPTQPAPTPAKDISQPTTTSETTATPESLHDQVRKKVDELIQQYPDNSPFKSIYKAGTKPEGVSYTIETPVPVNHIDIPRTYAQTTYGLTVFESDQPAVRIALDGQTEDYKVVKSQPVSIGFSTPWLEGDSQTAQKIIMEKEAWALMLWNPFTELATQIRKNQGAEFFGISQMTPSPEQIKNIIARDLHESDPLVRKLYDYAGYLAIMPQIELIANSNDTAALQMLQKTNILDIWSLAKERNIAFNNAIGSEAFMLQAMNPKSDWGNLITTRAAGE